MLCCIVTPLGPPRFPRHWLKVKLANAWVHCSSWRARPIWCLRPGVSNIRPARWPKKAQKSHYRPIFTISYYTMIPLVRPENQNEFDTPVLDSLMLRLLCGWFQLVQFSMTHNIFAFAVGGLLLYISSLSSLRCIVKIDNMSSLSTGTVTILKQQERKTFVVLHSNETRLQWRLQTKSDAKECSRMRLRPFGHFAGANP